METTTSSSAILFGLFVKVQCSNILYNLFNEGAKFLWWTWHDTDAPIREKLLGAPIGSSSWVITFSGMLIVYLQTNV